MLKSLFGKRQVCGVDLAAGRHRAVLAYLDGGEMIFQSAPELPGSSDIACALPARTCVVRRLNSPFRSLSKTRRVLPSLMDVQMPFSIEECSVAFTQLEKDPGGRISAVAAAARKEDVLKFIAAAEADGVKPMYLDAEGLAVWHGSVSEIPPGESEAVAVLRSEAAGSVLCLGKGRSIIAAHSLSSLEAGSVKRLLNAAFGGPCALEWRLAGGTAADAGTRKFVEDLGEAWIRTIAVHDAPGEFVARSVARRAMLGGSHAVNLRQSELLHPELAALNSGKVRGVAVILAGCGVVMAAVSIALTLVLESRISMLDDGFRSRASQLAGGDLGGASGIHALQRAETAVEKRLEQAAPILAPFEPSIMGFMRDIAEEARNRDLLIESLTIGPGEARIDGAAPSWAMPEAMEVFLRRKGLTVKLERQESLASESVHFTITAKGRY